jgi:hypothetical protein
MFLYNRDDMKLQDNDIWSGKAEEGVDEATWYLAW